MTTVRTGQGLQGTVGTGSAAQPSETPRTSRLLGLTNGSSFTQLTSSQGAVPPPATSSGGPTFRLTPGIDPQLTFANSLTATSGASGTSSATTAAAGTSGAASGSSSTAAADSTRAPDTSGQGANQYTGGQQAGKDEIQMVKDIMAELKADGEPGNQDDLYQVAIFIKGLLDKNLAKNYDEARKQYKKDIARIEQQANGQDPTYDT